MAPSSGIWDGSSGLESCAHYVSSPEALGTACWQSIINVYIVQGPAFCEAQGKGRAKGRPRKVTIRSFMDGGWWLVVYLSLMLYIKFG